MESNKLSSEAINSSSHVKVNTRRLPLVSIGSVEVQCVAP